MSWSWPTANTKRQVVRGHKFDFVDVNASVEKSWLRRLKYSFIFVLSIISTVIYLLDAWTAGILIFYKNWQSVKPAIPLEAARFIYLVCILYSFALLAWDARKARRIIRSRDIGLAYTNPLAYRIYCLRSYAHYCFFSQIKDSKMVSDDVAFFVFFTLKDWKRVIFADGPGDIVNGLTIFAILTDNPRKTIDFMGVYRKPNMDYLALSVMIISFMVFVVSAFRLLIALILYIPVFCHVQANLKEYCCRKIYRRITELVREQSRKRLTKKDLAHLLEEETADDGSPHAIDCPALPILSEPGVDHLISEHQDEPHEFGRPDVFDSAPPAYHPVERVRCLTLVAPIHPQSSTPTSGAGLQGRMPLATIMPPNGPFCAGPPPAYVDPLPPSPLVPQEWCVDDRHTAT